MIKKDNVNYRAFEGDCHPVNVFVGENKVAGYVSETAEGQELTLSNTYNDSYEEIKVFGKSEQKAKWYQAEGKTGQNGDPSPESPSELTSNIPAGSYQIPTENGIYEVTLTEDLRGIDDTYRDMIRFDSVSGTGYLERNTQLQPFIGRYIARYGSLEDETLHFGFGADNFDKTKIQVNQVVCTHFKHISDSRNPTMNNIRLYLNTDTFAGIMFDIRKEHLDITDFSDSTECVNSVTRWINEKAPVCVLPRTTPIKTALTFTKVESSSLPVLPWTAYGRNLVDNDYVFQGSVKQADGSYYFANVEKGLTGKTLKIWENKEGYTGQICVTLTCKVSGNAVNAGGTKYPNFAYTDGTYKSHYGKWQSGNYVTISVISAAGKIVDYIEWGYNTNNPTWYKDLAVYQSNVEKSYEPFNPTPPEALSVSPDYPQKIYDLSDVTVTSRGRNLTQIYDYNFNNMPWNQTLIEGVYTKPLTISFDAHLPDITNQGIIRVYYSDGTTVYRIKESPVTVNATPEKYITKIIVTKDNTATKSEDNYLKNIAIYEGAYTAETLPPFDKYRCTSATIPVVSSALEISKTLYDTLTDDYGRRTENGKYYVCDYVKMENGSVKYVSCISDDIIDGTLSFSIDGENRFFRGGYPYTLASDSIVYCSSAHLPGITHAEAYYNQKSGVSKMNGVISVAKQGIFADMTAADFNSWLVQQNSLETPFTVRYIRQNPVVTNITDTWSQDMIGLKTAPYYTKLFADKETGGISAAYKHF